MSPLTPQQIDAVAAKVVQHLHTGVKPVEKPKPIVVKDNKSVESGSGIFSNIDDAVKAAQSAFLKLNENIEDVWGSEYWSQSWNHGIMEEWVLERILSIINFITRTIDVLNSAAQFALRESFQPVWVTGRRVCPMSWRPIPIIPIFQHSKGAKLLS